uniref:Uncharacterized protein n=1 Tax=Stegastes partitus TaxID=144197 RepID=A0A3B5A979_9TELE
MKEIHLLNIIKILSCFLQDSCRCFTHPHLFKVTAGDRVQHFYFNDMSWCPSFCESRERISHLSCFFSLSLCESHSQITSCSGCFCSSPPPQP